MKSSGGWGSLFGIQRRGAGQQPGSRPPGVADDGGWAAPPHQPKSSSAHGGGLGVAGEAGPEAVVPLQRGASGNLGVAASPVTINVTNNTPSGSDEQQEGRRGRFARVEIQGQYAEGENHVLIDGTMDKTMRSTYRHDARQPSIG